MRSPRGSCRNEEKIGLWDYEMWYSSLRLIFVDKADVMIREENKEWETRPLDSSFVTFPSSQFIVTVNRNLLTAASSKLRTFIMIVSAIVLFWYFEWLLQYYVPLEEENNIYWVLLLCNKTWFMTSFTLLCSNMTQLYVRLPEIPSENEHFYFSNYDEKSYSLGMLCILAQQKKTWIMTKYVQGSHDMQGMEGKEKNAEKLNGSSRNE